MQQLQGQEEEKEEDQHQAGTHKRPNELSSTNKEYEREHSETSAVACDSLSGSCARNRSCEAGKPEMKLSTSTTTLSTKQADWTELHAISAFAIISLIIAFAMTSGLGGTATIVEMSKIGSLVSLLLAALSLLLFRTFRIYQHSTRTSTVQVDKV